MHWMTIIQNYQKRKDEKEQERIKRREARLRNGEVQDEEEEEEESEGEEEEEEGEGGLPSAVAKAGVPPIKDWSFSSSPSSSPSFPRSFDLFLLTLYMHI